MSAVRVRLPPSPFQKAHSSVGRALPLQGRCHRFESGWAYSVKGNAGIAQLVEQGIENPCVASSSLALGSFGNKVN